MKERKLADTVVEARQLGSRWRICSRFLPKFRAHQLPFFEFASVGADPGRASMAGLAEQVRAGALGGAWEGEWKGALLGLVEDLRGSLGMEAKGGQEKTVGSAKLTSTDGVKLANEIPFQSTIGPRGPILDQTGPGLNPGNGFLGRGESSAKGLVPVAGSAQPFPGCPPRGSRLASDAPPTDATPQGPFSPKGFLARLGCIGKQKVQASAGEPNPGMPFLLENKTGHFPSKNTYKWFVSGSSPWLRPTFPTLPAKGANLAPDESKTAGKPQGFFQPPRAS